MLHNDHSIHHSVGQQASLLHALFLEHPHEAGETYFQHLAFTLKQGAFLLVTAASLIAHGLVPATHQKTASERIFRLHALFKSRREKNYAEMPD